MSSLNSFGRDVIIYRHKSAKRLQSNCTASKMIQVNAKNYRKQDVALNVNNATDILVTNYFALESGAVRARL